MNNQRMAEVKHIFNKEIGNYLEHSRYDNASFLSMRAAVRRAMGEQIMNPLWAPTEKESEIFELLEQVGEKYDMLINPSWVEDSSDESIANMFHECLAKAQMIVAGRSGVRYITMLNKTKNKG